jgi:hypothetical protein
LGTTIKGLFVMKEPCRITCTFNVISIQGDGNILGKWHNTHF